ncbi:MAG TPA: DUF2252 domain-containing protein [Drouetiella sp.]
MATKDDEKAAKKTVNAASVLHDNTISPRDDRKERGKALKAAYPLEIHGEWKAPADRRSAIDILEESNIGRIEDLAPVRYGRMSVSPFTFFRGAAAIMAADLASMPNIGVKVQACGDCHLLNFGAFATPERKIVLDINDFDETLPAPWEWDVKRLAVSFVLAASEENKISGQNAARAVARAYREKMGEYAKMSIMDIWYASVDWQLAINEFSDEALQKHSKKALKKAKRRTIQDYYFPKMVQQVNGAYKIKDTPPTIYHFPDAEQDVWQKRITEAFAAYVQTLQEDRQRLFNRYRLNDFAIKVVGIGSVGTMCMVAIMLAPDDEPLMLQLKEARESVLAKYAGKSEFENQGQRVVAGQRIVQSASDIFLGWTHFDDGRHFYIRQLRDTKVKLDPELWKGEQLVKVAELLGGVLARAHARSGDAALLRGYLGSKTEFDDAIHKFSIAYAKQVEADYEELKEAIASGRIKIAMDSATVDEMASA